MPNYQKKFAVKADPDTVKALDPGYHGEMNHASELYPKLEEPAENGRTAIPYVCGKHKRSLLVVLQGLTLVAKTAQSVTSLLE